MPSWSDLRRYCEHEEWELYRQSGHCFYRKVLPDGRVLFTKVSFGSGEIPPALWRRILTKQLQVTVEQFNRGL